jgi:CheY-like chemotaxis protein
MPARQDQKRKAIRILLAEDNITNQLITVKMLRRLGQTNVTAVADGLLAVVACRTSHFRHDARAQWLGGH